MNTQQRKNNKLAITEKIEKQNLIEQIIEAKRNYYNLRDKYKRKFGETLYDETRNYKRKLLHPNDDYETD